VSRGQELDRPVDITVRRRGEGPELLLVHGGASPEATWTGLEPLAERWTLAYVYRRGFPPSPEGRHDFDRDAADLAPLLAGRPHVVAHSYGGLGATLAACAHPQLVRSLTLVEVPIHQVAPDDPRVSHLSRLGHEFMTEGLAMDRGRLREFLGAAGAPVPEAGPLPAAVIRAVRRAQGGRSPSEFHAPLERLRSARLPVLSASGAHAEGVERIADELARALNAERLVAPGAGHFVARAPGFAAQLARFLESVESNEAAG
jgi:pimeloyl-ACP methyl ester carboxylesterase